MNPRQDVLEAVRAAIRAADPQMLVRKKLRLRGATLVAEAARFDLPRYQRVLVIGGGKSSVAMARGVERVLGKWITAGQVNVPDYSKENSPSRRVEFNPSTHPLPSRKGVDGVRRMLSLINSATQDDLVICLVSGGASSMMPLPAPGLSMTEKSRVTRILMASGASISEVNVVRRHLSRIKGGRLAKTLFPATVLTLILSDVVRNRLEDVGSGPTAPDPSTFGDAKRILRRYGLWKKIPDSARSIVESGSKGLLDETPKPGSQVFKRVLNVIIGDNGNACTAAAKTMRRLGYHPLVLTTELEGEAQQAGKFLSEIVRQIDRDRFSLARPVALVMGGETTVKLKGKGRGGRNQELILSAALGIQKMAALAVASVGTDGLDGNTNAAGAIADGTSVRRGLRRSIDPQKYLNSNDSYNYFRQLGDLIMTGPTGTNVSDMTVVAAGALRD